MSGPRPRDLDRGVRIAITGKGGVGKSTLSALIARNMARMGMRVVAVDADEQCNLGATLGVDPERLNAVVPLAHDADYVEEKTGSRPGEGSGAMLQLNPDTSDVVERFSIAAPDDVRLLVMGGVRSAGGGCLCPETTLLAAAIANMKLRRGEFIIMDTHAGLEHFGRALARGFDQTLVVAEPTANAGDVALSTARLASELGITSIGLVINQCRSVDDVVGVLRYAEQRGGFDFSFIHQLPFDDRLVSLDASVGVALDDSALGSAIEALCREMISPYVASPFPDEYRLLVH